MEEKTVKNVFEVAWNEEQNKVPAWCVISTVNRLLKKGGVNARFELSQQGLIRTNQERAHY